MFILLPSSFSTVNSDPFSAFTVLKRQCSHKEFPPPPDIPDACAFQEGNMRCGCKLILKICVTWVVNLPPCGGNPLAFCTRRETYSTHQNAVKGLTRSSSLRETVWVYGRVWSECRTHVSKAHARHPPVPTHLATLTMNRAYNPSNRVLSCSQDGLRAK